MRASTCHDSGVEAVLWVILAVALAIGEAFTAPVLIILLAAGALAAAGAAALGAPVLIQAIVFAVVSGLSVGTIRPIIKKHRRSALESGEVPFGIEAIQGAPALVIEEVDTEHGVVKIDGELWTARTFDHTEKYLPGQQVRVIEIDGATAVVWRDDMTNTTDT